ncbi:hypothetical protein MMC10_008322 [Thelotrema lepadinum]|nr:hypothetical protein [Thelotrema lepadinum]
MNGVDFSYVGIQGIWEGNLGPDHSSRLRRPPLSIDVPKIIINLVNNTLDLPEIGLPRTARSYQRRLGLYILGFDPTPDVLLAKVKSMALAGHNSEAALHALLAGDFSLAATALRSGPRHGQNKALSLLLSLRAEKPNDSSLLAQITSIGANEKDPFSLGILSLLTSQTTSSPASLPPVYQLGLALKSLPDPALRSYLANVFNRATTSGNVAYLPLTGITHLSVRLFENYIARTSDLQSVVLALSHASPLYFRNPRIDAWRAEYRNLLNKYGLHIKRAQFDMQSTKLATTWNGQKTIQPERRQVTLKCGNCDGPLHREQEDGDLAKRQKRPPHPTHGKTQSQTLPYPPLLTSQSSDLSTMTTSTMPIGPTSAENSFTSTTSTSTSTEPAPSSSAGSLPTAGPSFALSRTPSLPQPPTSAPFVPDAPSNSATEDPSESVTTPVPPSTATSSITPGTAPGAPQQHRIFGGPKDGTMCPNCGARLPRCAVCDFWVGEVDPRSKGARARTRVRKQKPADTDEDGHEKAVNGKHQQDKDSNGGSEGGESYDEDEDGYEYDESDGDRSIESRRSRKGKKRDPDPMAGFVEICLSCRHVYHRGHAKEWFARHDECAAVGCRCLCGGLDGGVAGT